jgi:hypothetical protein
MPTLAFLPLEVEIVTNELLKHPGQCSNPDSDHAALRLTACCLLLLFSSLGSLSCARVCLRAQPARFSAWRAASLNPARRATACTQPVCDWICCLPALAACLDLLPACCLPDCTCRRACVCACRAYRRVLEGKQLLPREVKYWPSVGKGACVRRRASVPLLGVRLRALRPTRVSVVLLLLRAGRGVLLRRRQ